MTPKSSQKSIRNIQSHYRTGGSDLAVDFFGPCLANCSLYRRSSGYFSSTALASWLAGLERLSLGAEFEVRIIASPELSPQDVKALRATIDENSRAEIKGLVIDRLIDEIATLAKEDSELGQFGQLFAWLVINGFLNIRFAIPAHIESPGIFHEKIGIFDFPDGDQIAFIGSANETYGGHVRNYESVDVFRSWEDAELHRVVTKQDQFDEAWNNESTGLDVRELSEKTISQLREVAPKIRPKIQPLPRPKIDSTKVPDDDRWKHQEVALTKFLEKKAGVLEMATGTGKTRTALSIIERLVRDESINGAIISVEGPDLLMQWSIELDEFVGKWPNLPFLIYRHFGSFHQLGDFALDHEQAILVISRGQLARLFQRLPAEERNRMIIVHDEIHGLGAPGYKTSLKGEHQHFPYRLGLSATPERTYDQEGNEFIENEIGGSIFRFPLEAAIAKGILCEFDYIPLEYELTEHDRERLRQVYAKQAARRHAGNPMSQEEVWIEISRVYKTAEMKPSIFFQFLKNNTSVLERCIIFVETLEYGNKLLEEIHKYTRLYRTYYAEDDEQNLIEFAKGQIDCLITCHRISQGIDIRSLEHVVLFASARSRLETIQRIGRCLRTNPDRPNKRARVIDFVRPQDQDDSSANADQERCQWLLELSQVKRGDAVAT